MNSSPAFTPSPLLRSAHVQTVFATLARPAPSLARVREKFALPDGDELWLDWFDNFRDGTSPDRPLVVILHGLAGSSDSIYVLGIQQALHAVGIGSVAMNFRGAGGRHNLFARTYHAGDTADIDALLKNLTARFPERPLALLGYSLGGNVTLKWLGENGRNAVVVAACAVSAPFDLAECSRRLDEGFSRIYRNRLRDELIRNLQAKRDVLASAGNTDDTAKINALGDLATISTFREYDDRIVAPLHGFRDADDYYAKSSARFFLREIATPTLIVHALDDPFMTPAVAPTGKDVPDCVELAISAHGGHVGFVGSRRLRPHWWLEEKIPAWFLSRFSSI